MVKELGCYALGGAPASSREVIDESRDAERLGFGTVFLSERWNLKEAATLSGAAGAVTEKITIATGATNPTTRHPLITASYASTMHSLTGGRFVLGIGRGVKPLFDAFGMQSTTTAQMEDFAGVMRRLWRGETIIDHDGPLGRFPVLKLDDRFDLDIPLGIVAFGPQTLALGGRAYDHVILHTFFTDETLVRCVGIVRDAAERAGRDPDAVTVWSLLATIPDTLTEEERLMKTVGRLGTYLQLYGDLLVRTNNWDPAVLDAFRAAPVVQGFGRTFMDSVATTEQLEEVAALLPDEWLAASATGTPENCAAGARNQLALGAGGVILHGVTPRQLEPVVNAYTAHQQQAAVSSSAAPSLP